MKLEKDIKLLKVRILNLDNDMTNVVAYRKALNDAGKVKVSFNDILMKACESVIRHGLERGEVSGDVDPAEVARILCMGGDGLLFLHFVMNEHEKGLDSLMAMTELVMVMAPPVCRMPPPRPLVLLASLA